MGGTVRRLVQQGHDVSIAFQTDGDVAVSDEDLQRSLILAKRVFHYYYPDKDNQTYEQILERLGKEYSGVCLDLETRDGE